MSRRREHAARLGRSTGHGEVRDDARRAGLALMAQVFHGPNGPARRATLPFRRAALSFMRWARRAAACSPRSTIEPPGSVWWRAVNERAPAGRHLRDDDGSVRRLLAGPPSSHAVQLCAGVSPSGPRGASWYRAQQREHRGRLPRAPALRRGGERARALLRQRRAGTRAVRAHARRGAASRPRPARAARPRARRPTARDGRHSSSRSAGCCPTAIPSRCDVERLHLPASNGWAGCSTTR